MLWLQFFLVERSVSLHFSRSLFLVPQLLLLAVGAAAVGHLLPVVLDVFRRQDDVFRGHKFVDGRQKCVGHLDAVNGDEEGHDERRKLEPEIGSVRNDRLAAKASLQSLK